MSTRYKLITTETGVIESTELTNGPIGARYLLVSTRNPISGQDTAHTIMIADSVNPTAGIVLSSLFNGLSLQSINSQFIGKRPVTPSTFVFDEGRSIELPAFLAGNRFYDVNGRRSTILTVATLGIENPADLATYISDLCLSASHVQEIYDGLHMPTTAPDALVFAMLHKNL